LTALELVLAGSAGAGATAWLQRRYTRRSDHRQQREHALVLLLGNLAAAANEANTPTQALQASLRLICRYGRWSFGHVVTFVPGTRLANIVETFWEHDGSAPFATFSEQMGATTTARQPVPFSDAAQGLTLAIDDFGAGYSSLSEALEAWLAARGTPAVVSAAAAGGGR
jgi:hypothetical protein